MRLKNVLWILLVNSVFANAVNLLFLAKWTQTIWQDWHHAIVLGLVVYGVQSAMLYRLCEPFRNLLPFRQVISFRSLAVGLAVAVGIWLVAQGAAVGLNQSPVTAPSNEKLFRFLVVFVFNTVIGAFLEEFVFRFLPVEYGRQAGLGKPQFVLLLLGVTAWFAVTHLSAYLFRDQLSVERILPALWNPFGMGILMTLVYWGTKNLYFITILHAFGNNGIYWVETPYPFITVLTATALWAAYRQVAGGVRSNRKSNPVTETT